MKQYFIPLSIVSILFVGCTTQTAGLPTATLAPSSSELPTPTNSPTASPTVTASPTLKPSAKPTLKPTAKPSTQAQVQVKSGLRAEPASIKATAKRAEFDKLPAFHLYYPGHHKIGMTLLDGTTPIGAQIFPYTTYGAVDMNDVAIIKIQMMSSFGRGIPTGVSKETIQIREITGIDDFVYNYPVILSIPVEINLLD